jgi:hypothetical protein
MSLNDSIQHFDQSIVFSTAGAVPTTRFATMKHFILTRFHLFCTGILLILSRRRGAHGTRVMGESGGIQEEELESRWVNGITITANRIHIHEKGQQMLETFFGLMKLPQLMEENTHIIDTRHEEEWRL